MKFKITKKNDAYYLYMKRCWLCSWVQLKPHWRITSKYIVGAVNKFLSEDDCRASMLQYFKDEQPEEVIKIIEM